MNGKINGKGTIYLASGDKYVGEWKDGRRHGFGTYHYRCHDEILLVRSIYDMRFELVMVISIQANGAMMKGYVSIRSELSWLGYDKLCFL